MKMEKFMTKDKQFMRRAIDVAMRTKREGNPPVGAVITLAGANASVDFYHANRKTTLDSLPRQGTILLDTPWVDITSSRSRLRLGYLAPKNERWSG